ncbi:tRNA (adenosine(37)-N6)-threonylcarbamoyltransferase complex ATPase subunit type 1 TsaE [Rubinisphaera margarita]|uniref:tRNA (adenosine(37)-N6)-threonylcarbamoyltransferase complex ATPase subunit type 1 TsaE n=1 Tax=Rubinisphaera margarita TaxID=2909586 RepID=UPI001EE7DFF4|nr:tRNA (adenosine(37)-N6)-threonylcarbamoyltransferase complex ATPase subunit type 1 TsaE [Rubinisphaera margarita]MCG6156016.1 tRNA (adenosine(37)-N6)-threonylcarbamoyltransferase complex ATPase subunit type 1 TsaE [Rubinisphaera margarita]
MNDDNPERSIQVVCHSEAETARLAAQIALKAEPGLIIRLDGELGAGKTCFVRNFAEALGVDSQGVNSPTYVIVQHYLGDYLLHHFDLYRVVDEDELYEMGADELLEGKGISLVEWASRFAEFLPRDGLSISIDVTGPTERVYNLSAEGAVARSIVAEIAELHS